MDVHQDVSSMIMSLSTLENIFGPVVILQINPKGWSLYLIMSNPSTIHRSESERHLNWILMQNVEHSCWWITQQEHILPGMKSAYQSQRKICRSTLYDLSSIHESLGIPQNFSGEEGALEICPLEEKHPWTRISHNFAPDFTPE